MHLSSRAAMGEFRKTLPERGKVLDVGSLDINGSYRYLFDNWEYIGLDIIPGRNVDYIPDDPYDWKELESNFFDAVISGQAVEHIEFPEKTFNEIARVLKPNCLICVIGPTVGGKHHEPWFRDLTPSYMRKLAEDVGLEVLNINVNNESIWHDCILIAKKPGDKKNNVESKG